MGALAGAGYFFFRERGSFGGVGHSMSRAGWAWLVAAAGLELASALSLAEAQRLVLRVGGVEVPRRALWLITLASNAISTSLPAGVAVAEGYSYRQYRRFGGSAAGAGWAELAMGAIAFAALATLAVAGALAAGGRSGPFLVAVLSVVLVGSLGAAAAFRRPRLLGSGLRWVSRRLGPRAGGAVARSSTRLAELSGDLDHLQPPRRVWLAAYGLSELNWLADAASLAVVFLAAGRPVPWGAVLVGFAGTKVVSSVGITPGGLGIVEGGLAATFVAYGTTAATALAAALMYRAVTVVGLVVPGWLAAGLIAVRNRPGDGVATDDALRDGHAPTGPQGRSNGGSR